MHLLLSDAATEALLKQKFIFSLYRELTHFQTCEKNNLSHPPSVLCHKNAPLSPLCWMCVLTRFPGVWLTALRFCVDSHLLPKAQASSLPRNPPPMMVMDFSSRETFSSALKSSICVEMWEEKLKIRVTVTINLEQKKEGCDVNIYFVYHASGGNYI